MGTVVLYITVPFEVTQHSTEPFNKGPSKGFLSASPKGPRQEVCYASAFSYYAPGELEAPRTGAASVRRRGSVLRFFEVWV